MATVTPVTIKILALAFDKRTPEQEAVTAFLKARNQIPDYFNVLNVKAEAPQKESGFLRMSNKVCVTHTYTIPAIRYDAFFNFLSNWCDEPYFRLTRLEKRAKLYDDHKVKLYLFLKPEFYKIFNDELSSFIKRLNDA